MRREQVTTGIAAVMFAVLSLVGLILGNAPGGDYSSSKITKFVGHGHRPEVYVSLYCLLVAAAALLYLVSGLRGRVAEGPAARLVTGAGYASGAAWAAGAAVLFTIPIGLSNGGSKAPADPHVIYMFSQAGYAMLFGAGAVLLAIALIAFGVGTRAAVPSWVRWFTLAAGIVGLFSLAFFPFFILLLWGLVFGIWMITAGRREPTGAPDARAHMHSGG